MACFLVAVSWNAAFNKAQINVMLCGGCACKAPLSLFAVASGEWAASFAVAAWIPDFAEAI